MAAHDPLPFPPSNFLDRIGAIGERRNEGEVEGEEVGKGDLDRNEDEVRSEGFVALSLGGERRDYGEGDDLGKGDEGLEEELAPG